VTDTHRCANWPSGTSAQRRAAAAPSRSSPSSQILDAEVADWLGPQFVAPFHERRGIRRGRTPPRGRAHL